MRRLFGFAGCVLMVLSPALVAQEFPPTDGDPFIAPGAPHQDKPGQPFKLTVNARVVVLDVVVTDKHGMLINRSDLKRGDFAILEDGKPQDIRSFEAPAAHRMPASEKPVVSSAADLKKIGDAPVTVLVLDELNSH